MKKFVIGTLALALSVALFTGCGCQNTDPMTTEDTTILPTPTATIAPTTQPTTTPTTAPTTEATTIPTETQNAGTDTTNGTNGMDDTQPAEETTDNARAGNRAPSNKGY